MAGGGAGLGDPALVHGSDGAAPDQGVLHLRRAAGLGQGELVLLGRTGLARVGQPLFPRRCGRALEGAAVGSEAPLPLDQADESSAAAGGHLAVLQWAREHGCPWGAGTCEQAAGGGHMAVYLCCGGRESTTARGTVTRVRRRLGAGTFRCCGGHGRTTARGTLILSNTPLSACAWRGSCGW